MGNRKKTRAGVSRESVVREKGCSAVEIDSHGKGHGSDATAKMGIDLKEKGKAQVMGAESEQSGEQVSPRVGPLTEGVTEVQAAIGKVSLRGGSAGSVKQVSSDGDLSEGAGRSSVGAVGASRGMRKIPMGSLCDGASDRILGKIPVVALPAKKGMLSGSGYRSSPVALENSIVSDGGLGEGPVVADLEDVQVDFSGSDEEDDLEVEEPCITPIRGIKSAVSADPLSSNSAVVNSVDMSSKSGFPLSPNIALENSAEVCLKPGFIQSIIVDNRPLEACSIAEGSAAVLNEKGITMDSMAGIGMAIKETAQSGGIGENSGAPIVIPEIHRCGMAGFVASNLGVPRPKTGKMELVQGEARFSSLVDCNGEAVKVVTGEHSGGNMRKHNKATAHKTISPINEETEYSGAAG